MFDVAMLLTGSGDSGILNILKGMTGFIGQAGQILVVLFGLVMVIGGVFQIAKGMLGGQRAQVNWVMAIGLILVGGALAFSGGFALLGKLSTTTSNTLDTMADGNDYGYTGGDYQY